MISNAPARSPRLVVRVLGFAFAVIACVNAGVFVIFSWQTNARMRRSVVENMEANQRRFASIEARLKRERTLQARTLAENPTLKAAIDTYYVDRGGDHAPALLSTIETELTKLQQMMDVPALSITDLRGVILASAGPFRQDWPRGERLRLHVDETGAPVETVIERNGRPYAATAIPLAVGLDVIGEFFLASPFDSAYATELARESRADVAVLLDGRVIASTLSQDLRHHLEGVALPLSGTVMLGRDEFVVQRLSAVDAAHVYALGSVTAAAHAAGAETAFVLLVAGLGALVIAAGGSWWLARAVARPINELSESLARMAKARHFAQPMSRRGGGSRELDTLAATFDELRTAVTQAEAESEAAYLGVIGALATALDARDPYTAGHSQRVADLSVDIGRQMHLPEPELESLRLGALLHDIGKIGVSDAILRKPGKLTAEEFEQIKLHPTLGARILKPLAFLEAQLAIVELHHERPDGRGYPHGLKGDEIPVAARIVHVADAFDAMTNARAYRSAMSVAAAVAELWRCIGADFDPQVVQAMAALPVAVVEPAAVTPAASAPGSLVAFPPRTPTLAAQTATLAWRRAE